MTTAYDGGVVPRIELRHRLRIAREFAQLEQEQLADLIGVSRTTISNTENGRSQPRRIVLNAWALSCGVPIQWILTGNDETPPPGDDGGESSRLPASIRVPIHYKGTEIPLFDGLIAA
jgi:transcriptional regulator with XRE-family HTH domain